MFITISMSEYERLKRDHYKLQALEQQGVDNWDGYGDAMDVFESWEENEKIQRQEELKVKQNDNK